MSTTATTLLDLLGILLLVAALAVLVWTVSPAAALATSGVLLLGVSWALDALARTRRPGGEQ